MKKTLMVASILLLAASFSYAQNSGTSVVSVNVGAEAAIVVTAGGTALTSSTTFGDYKGTTNFTYYIRTNTGGSITVQFDADFSPTAGPSIASPVTSSDTLTYTCTNAITAAACSSTMTVSALTTTYNVATFGALVQSAKGGNAASVLWDLTNDPAYKYGNYTATATFTISAS